MKRFIRKLIKALTPLFAAVVLAIIGAAAFVPDVSAQVLRRGGGGVLSREFWTESNGVLTPTNPNATIGSSSNRVAGIYANTLDALTLTISGSVPGNLTVTGTIAVLGSGTSTFEGPVSTTQLIVPALTGTSAPIVFQGPSVATLGSTAAGLFEVRTGGSKALEIGSSSALFYRNNTPATNNAYDLGASSLAWRNGYFSGTVSTTLLLTQQATSSWYGFANTGNIRWQDLGSSFVGLTQGTVNWITVSAGNGRMVLNNARTGSSGLIADVDGVGSIGGASNRFLNGFFSGVVTSTDFEVASGGVYKSRFTGSASAPIFCFDDGTDGCNDGMYMWAVDGVAIATNGTQRLRVTTGGVQVVGNLSSTTDNTDDLGTPTARFNDAFFGGNVSSTGLILSTLNTGTPAASLCIDSGGNVIKVVGANCF